MNEQGKRGHGQRIQQGVHIYRSQHDGATYDDIGRRVAEVEGRERPYGKSTVSGWISEQNEPRLSTFDALAVVLGGDPYWYAWGVGHPPENPLTTRLRLVPNAKRPADGEP